MKILTLITLTLFLGACTSAKKREECKVTCLEKNTIYQEVQRHGCMCVEKEDPNQRIYNEVELD